VTQRTIEPLVTQALKLCLNKIRIHERIIMYPFTTRLSKGSVDLEFCGSGTGEDAVAATSI
jgi:hypothetical protein